MRSGVRRHGAVAPLVLVGMLVPVWISRRVLPDGSTNLDELGYLSQAEALRAGHLTLSASSHSPFFVPYLSGVHDGHIVFKYQPVWPALLALVRTVTGSYTPALALTAGTAVLALYWFAWELAQSRRVALIAATLLCASPFFLVQASTYLSYPASLTVLLLAGAAVLRGQRNGSTAWLAVAGAALGLAFFSRSYDAVLWGVPLVAYVGLRDRSPIRASLTRLGWMALGAAPFMSANLAYDWAVTGSPTRTPFSVSGPTDTFGFGWHSSFEVARRFELHYTPGQALHTLGAYAADLPRWMAGGGVLLALALWMVFTRLRDPAIRLLLGLSLAFPVGYFFWWGSENSVNFKLDRVMGPIYWFPIVAPLVVLAALAVERIVDMVERARQPLAGGLIAAVMLGSTVLFANGVPHAVSTAGRDRKSDVAETLVGGSGRTLMLTPPQFAGDPYVHGLVTPSLSQRHLVALDARPGVGRFALLDRLPNRTDYELVPMHSYNDLFAPTHLVRRKLSVQTGSAFRHTITVEAPQAAAAAVLYASVGGVAIRIDRGPAAKGQRIDAEVSVDATRLSFAGRSRRLHLRPGQALELVVGIGYGSSTAAKDLSDFELRWSVRVVASHGRLRLEGIDPPDQWHRYLFPNGLSAWSTESVAGVVG